LFFDASAEMIQKGEEYPVYNKKGRLTALAISCVRTAFYHALLKKRLRER
jgi:hypothetical protein